MSIKKSHALLAIVASLWMFSSCIPHKEILYFQDHDQRAGYSNPFGETETITEKYILQANDALIIRVNTANPKLSEFFNMGGTNQNTAARSERAHV